MTQLVNAEACEQTVLVETPSPASSDPIITPCINKELWPL